MINTLADGTVQDKFLYFYDAAGNLVSKKEASEAAEEIGHQLIIEARQPSQIDYRRVGVSAAFGTLIASGSTLAGASLNHLKEVRAAKKVEKAAKSAGNALPMERNLRYFAGDVVEGGSNTVRSTNVPFMQGSIKNKTTAEYLSNIENISGNLYTNKKTIDSIGKIEAVNEDFSLLNRVVSSQRISSERGFSTVYKYSNSYGTKYLIHEVTDANGYVIHRDFDAVRVSSGQLINKR